MTSSSLSSPSPALQNSVGAPAPSPSRPHHVIRTLTFYGASHPHPRVRQTVAEAAEMIPAEAFVPFGSRKPGGTGVGLIIARTMIEGVHGGTLSFESARGLGTTVRVVLPAHATRNVSHG